MAETLTDALTGTIRTTLSWTRLDTQEVGSITNRKTVSGSYAITDGDATHPGTDRLDDPRALAAEPRRQRAGIETGALVDVDEIEPDRGLPDQHLAAARLRSHDRFPAQDLWTAVGVDADGVRHWKGIGDGG
jgi:hypothetical protein